MDFEGFTVAARTYRIAKKAGVVGQYRIDGEWRDEVMSPYGFPASTSLGGYTLVYLTRNGDSLCASCMGDPDYAKLDDARQMVVSVDTYDEGPVIQCDGCNQMIESSYGDPDQEDQAEKSQAN